MLTIDNNSQSCIVNCESYCAVLSKQHGGSLRELIFNNINTKLYREGTEYWLDEQIHYEQEFGKLLYLNYKLISDNQIDIFVYATLAQPVSNEDRVHGGFCKVKWNFKPDSITTSSQIIPCYPCDRYDKYVCFRPNQYVTYTTLNDNIEKPIGNVDLETGWWKQKYTNIGGMSVKKEDMKLSLVFDKHLNNAGIYQSKGMMEV